MKLLKKKSGSKSRELYKSIYDMPIFNWFKMRNKSALSFLFKDKSLHGTELGELEGIKLKGVYLDLLTQFFEEFGQTKAFKDEVKLKSQFIDLCIEFSKTGEIFLLNSIAILREKIAKKQADSIDKESGIDDEKEQKRQIALVSESFGRPMDVREITVLQFYTQLEIINK